MKRNIRDIAYSSNIWAVVGGQAGSEGKGKVAAYLAQEFKPHLVACAFSANAGHTAYDEEGNRIVVHTIPVGALNENALVVIGPGAAIRMDRLKEDWEQFEDLEDRLLIDSRAMVITKEDVEREQATMEHISSTCQGVGQAYSRRLLRGKDVLLARDYPDLEPWIGDARETLTSMAETGARIQIEGCQGADLDLLYGIEYPYCTSRPTNIDALCSDVGLPGRFVESVFVVSRTYPIRVGNVVRDGKQVGWSGPIPEDSIEYTWDEITAMSGSPERIEERTTVTNKVRRIFSWSPSRHRYNWRLMGGTHLWINFADYLDYSLRGVDSRRESLHPNQVRLLNNWIRGNEIDPQTVVAFGTGPKNYEVIRW